MMNRFKYLPMATIGFSALAIMLCVILSGHNFEGGMVAVAFGVLFLTVTVISKKLREVTVLFYLSASLIFSGVLMIANETCSLDVAKSVTGKDVNVVATVTGESESYPSKSVFILKAESVNGTEVDVKLRLVSNTSIFVNAGDKISFKSKVYSVDGFEDSLKRYYMSEGIYLGANIYDGDEAITVLEDGSNTLACKLQQVRDEIKTRIYSVLPNEFGAVSVAMLLGDKSEVSDETLQSFRGSGVYHLFAVSGLHLSIWVLGIFSFLEKLGISKRLNSFAAILVTVVFMALTGFSPSVSRAGIMLIAVMSGNLFGRSAHTLNSLGFALFVILAVNPMSAAGVSLLLSFSATLGIVCLYPKADEIIVSKLNIIKPRLLRKAVTAVISVFFVSLCAGLFTLPVSAAFFGEACIIGPITNVFVSYAATVMMMCAGGIALLFSFSSAANLCGLVCGLLAKYIIAISDKFSSVPFSSVKTDNLLFWIFMIVVACVMVLSLIVIKNKTARVKAIIASVLCMSIICSCVHFVYNRNLTTVKIMDVDDGICIVASNGEEKAVIGCGSSDNYCIDDVIYEIYDKTPSLLIIPDKNEWNSSLSSQLINKMKFERIISGESIDGIPSITEADFKLNPWKNGSIEFHKNDEITYAYCVFGSSDMLIVFNSAENADFSDHPVADVLICSYYLPDNMNLAAFDSIIVSSTHQVVEDMIKLYSSENPNIYSTLGETDFTVKMKKDKPIEISYN